MYSGDRYIFRYTNIDLFLASDVDPFFVLKGNEFKYFSLTVGFFLYDFQHDIGFFRFGDIHGVKLLIVQVNSIFVLGLAHFATEGLPIYRHAQISNHSFDLFG
jgi:hypothetical protein